MATSSVKGFKELQAKLRGLPQKLAKNVIRGAVRAGASAMRREVLTKVPVGPPNAENVRLYGGYEGALRDTVRVVSRSDKGDGEIKASVVAGGTVKKNGAEVFYAHMLEFGTAAHLIEPSTKEALTPGNEVDGFAGEVFAASVEHPGTQPTYFMTRSMIAGQRAFVEATRKYMETRIDKELKK
jgi:HK97 gp10 family phage protein